MREKLKQITGDSLLKAGIIIYVIGFISLYLVYNNYTGFFAYFAPFSIVCGILLISIGLLK